MTAEENPCPSIMNVGASFSSVLEELHASAFEPKARWSSRAFTDLFATPGILAFLVLVQEEPAGFIMARHVADEAEILTLAVAPEWRRQRLASILTETLLTDLFSKGTSRIFLEVSVSNRAARSLYAATGFITAGLRKRYYEDGSDAEVMTREIICSSGS